MEKGKTMKKPLGGIRRGQRMAAKLNTAVADIQSGNFLYSHSRTADAAALRLERLAQERREARERLNKALDQVHQRLQDQS